MVQWAGHHGIPPEASFMASLSSGSSQGWEEGPRLKAEVVVAILLETRDLLRVEGTKDGCWMGV